MIEDSWDTTASSVAPREFFVREALPHDVSAMFDIRGLVDENRMSRSELAAIGITDEVIQRRLDTELAAWVAELDGAVVGYSMSDHVRGCVYAVFVLPNFQGRGIGTALLNRAKAHLFGRGFVRPFLRTDASTRAYRFYLRQGWTDAGESNESRRRLELDARDGIG